MYEFLYWTYTSTSTRLNFVEAKNFTPSAGFFKEWRIENADLIRFILEIRFLGQCQSHEYDNEGLFLK